MEAVPIHRGARRNALLIFLDICSVCQEHYDDRYDNLGLDQGKCYSCIKLSLKTPCCNVSKICSDPSCRKCFNKSFASCPKSIYANASSLTARSILKTSTKRLHFTCQYGHNFNLTPKTVSRGRWCSFCRNQTEKQLYSWLLSMYPQTVYQAKFDWCCSITTGRKFPFDFVLDNIIIELDGAQHFRTIRKWKSTKRTNVQRDVYKMKAAVSQGYSVIRISQADVWTNRIDWKTLLVRAISNCTTVPTVQYLARDANIYNLHKSAFKAC